jgi:ParB/RepB/Spo0J family partition protein
MAIHTDESARSVALDLIDVPDNVRELDAAHVQALAGSMALQGLLVPLVVRRAGERFELVAGFHRAAAARSLGMTDVPVVVREAESEEADRAVENIAPKQLTALEEARAVRAMLQRGLSEDGAAQALGWAKARVTARVKILELPEAAQQLVGEGVIALGAIDNLLAVGRASPELLDALVAHVDENRWAADRLGREPGWVLGQAMREGKVKTFGAYLNQAGSHELEALRLGKKAAEQLAEAERLHHQLDRYAYGPPAIRFNDADVDQARAAGALIEFEHGTPVICDRGLFRELAKGAIARTVEELRERAAAAATVKKAAKANGPADPLVDARRERDSRLRAAADSAHAANLDLGVALINGLTVVDPADINVARFLVLCGLPHRTNYADGLAMPMSGASVLGTRLRRSESGVSTSAGPRRLRPLGRVETATCGAAREAPRPGWVIDRGSAPSEPEREVVDAARQPSRHPRASVRA